MKTEKYKAVIGVNPGYGHNNESMITLENFGIIWQNKAKEVFDSGEGNAYVSAVIYPCNTVYNKVWGCPEGGEKCYVVEATRNPKFFNDAKRFEENFHQIVNHMMKRFNQSTVTVEKFETDVTYIENREKL